MPRSVNTSQGTPSLVWVVNLVLLSWVLIHAVPKFRIDTIIYPPTSVLPDGSQYYGLLRDGEFHGDGKLVWANADVYIGEFSRGRMEGKGALRLANGDTLTGTFRAGSINGKGEFRTASGDFYSGSFANGYIDGAGRYEYNNSTYYEGEFALGYFHGQGEMKYGNGQIFTGTFVRGDIVNGEHRDNTGNVYVGEFKNWSYFGEGRLAYAFGDILEGYFEDGLLVAHGKHILTDGSMYEGEFLSSLYHGEGKFEGVNGDSYVGAFEYGQFHGEGERSFKNEEGETVTQKGEWRYGIYQGSRKEKSKPKREYIGDALYNQQQLLEKSKDQLVAQNENAIDMYFLGGAGDGSQDVFLKEINYVTQKLRDLYSLEGKITRLINHVDTQYDEPLFTLTSLVASIDTIASVMDVENDILLMYLTSHGSAESGFYINDKRVNLHSLGAKTLSDYLNASPIKWRVVIISACYSGGFIPHLNDENTLVMTAARDDRQSFGCSNDSEMTYFGKAFFKESLNSETTFFQAFESAKKVVEGWEDEDEVEDHSEPQIHIGTAIAEHLTLWRDQLDSRSL